LVKPSDLVVIGTLTAGVAAAAAIDLRTRRVPNPLTAFLALSGVGFAASGIGHLTIAGSIAGLLLGLALMLPGHVIGGTGAGDVKLFAAMGALLGPAPIVGAFLYTAIAGGALAVIIAWHRRRLQRTFGRTARLVTREQPFSIRTGHRGRVDSGGDRFVRNKGWGPYIWLGCECSWCSCWQSPPEARWPLALTTSCSTRRHGPSRSLPGPWWSPRRISMSAPS
jgi:Flp pilus assembly protein protease CpaA